MHSRDIFSGLPWQTTLAYTYTQLKFGRANMRKLDGGGEFVGECWKVGR